MGSDVDSIMVMPQVNLMEPRPCPAQRANQGEESPTPRRSESGSGALGVSTRRSLAKRKSWWPHEGGPKRSKLDESAQSGGLGSLKAGGYVFGRQLGSAPVKCISHCLARKESTDDYFMAKVLLLPTGRPESQDERQGKMLLHTEQALLAILAGEKGVIRMHDLVKDQTHQVVPMYGLEPTRRITLILDCLVPNLFTPKAQDYVNLQQHVIKQKRLPEKEALNIFYHIVKIVARLHRRNVIHRDLKLGNVVLDRRSQTVTLTNFCLGKHLMNEEDLLTDQRGSPAYISPDVLSGKPYRGKPSDIWALGVVLFTMLYGQFPFYHSLPQELFNKIKSADFRIPSDDRISEECKALVKKILIVDPNQRIGANDLLGELESVIFMWRSVTPSVKDLQVVPEFVESQRQTSKDKQKEDQQSAAEMANAEVFLNFIHATDRAEIEDHSGKIARGSDTPNSRGSFPVTRLNSDARELTDEEYRRFGPLINQMRHSTIHTNSSTGQPLANNGSGQAKEGSANRGIAQMASPVLVSADSPLIAVLRRQNRLRSAPPGPITPAASPVPGIDEAQALDLSSSRPIIHGPTVLLPPTRPTPSSSTANRYPPASTRRFPASSAPLTSSGRAPGHIPNTPALSSPPESSGLRGLRAALDQMSPGSVAMNEMIRNQGSSEEPPS
eukprot:snap_masked-scaffold1137_size60140-processed-gene-0.7 protein:Tk10574 transcript:snap_masked-scaffold1137_size60140-processed-gene-0.7-mRNA-1 annotation:"serine threonine-protein kinase 40"